MWPIFVSLLLLPHSVWCVATARMRCLISFLFFFLFFLLFSSMCTALFVREPKIFSASSKWTFFNDSVSVDDIEKFHSNKDFMRLKSLLHQIYYLVHSPFGSFCLCMCVSLFFSFTLSYCVFL